MLSRSLLTAVLVVAHLGSSAATPPPSVIPDLPAVDVGAPPADEPDAVPPTDAVPDDTSATEAAPDAATDDAPTEGDAWPPVDAPPVDTTLSRPASLEHTADPGPLHRPWTAWFSAGFSFFFMVDSPLGDQLEDAGYTLDIFTPAFGFSLERYVLDWLIVGGGLDLHWSSGDHDTSRFSNALSGHGGTEIVRPALHAYVQPTFCLEYGSCRREGFFMGFQLGAAVGPTFWLLHDGTDTGAHVRLDGAILWIFSTGDFVVAFRLLHSGVWQSDLGPRDLGHGLLWQPTLDLRMGFRW